MKKTSTLNFQRKLLLHLFALLAFILLFSNFATADIKPTSTTNPPPKYELSRYEKFIIEPVVFSEEWKRREAKNREEARIEAEKSGSTMESEVKEENTVYTHAAAKIQENLDNKLKPLLQSWNKDTQNSAAKTIIIKPIIESIYFNPGSTIAGKSTVLLRVMIVEQKSGQVIANPEFYQHANAWGAAYSFGATNNAMLNRVSELALQYISDNYKSAVGGKTGVEK